MRRAGQLSMYDSPAQNLDIISVVSILGWSSISDDSLLVQHYAKDVKSFEVRISVVLAAHHSLHARARAPTSSQSRLLSVQACPYMIHSKTPG